MTTPMTPRGNIIVTAIMAVLMSVLLMRVYILSQFWWPVLMVTLVYAAGSIYTLWLQDRHRDGAVLIRKVFAIPSACAGAMAVWFVYALQQHPGTLSLLN
jgi:hypothetical protein